ncbi:hypothetical protein [Synechococcus sp. UW140]|uniref:hypothetical protein n=1 Tax=Synechococcus sp. UW140 TaxID=368503 RepID=UPI000E0E4E9E|nr:hypothetical protein [Synechococcus sp. UW140]
MNFNHGATVTPDISLDPTTGEEVISYDNANIDWAGQRDAVLTEFDRHQDELLTFNEFNGDVEHEYDTTHSEDFLRGAELPEYDLEQLRGLVGGDDAFNDLKQWGSQNLNPEQIQEFDQIMASNDYPVMEEAILNLYNYYLENWSGEDAYEEYSEPEQEIEEESEQDELDIQFNESVLEHFGDENYQAMTEWAAENLRPQDIEAYDRAMDSPDHDYKSQMINWLSEQYQNSIY